MFWDPCSVHAACQHDAVQLLNIMHSQTVKHPCILLYLKEDILLMKGNLFSLSDPRGQREAAVRAGLGPSRAGEVQDDFGEVRFKISLSSFQIYYIYI